MPTAVAGIIQKSEVMPPAASYEQRTRSNTRSRSPSLTLPLKGGGKGWGWKNQRAKVYHEAGSQHTVNMTLLEGGSIFYVSLLSVFGVGA